VGSRTPEAARIVATGETTKAENPYTGGLGSHLSNARILGRSIRKTVTRVWVRGLEDSDADCHIDDSRIPRPLGLSQASACTRKRRARIVVSPDSFGDFQVLPHVLYFRVDDIWCVEIEDVIHARFDVPLGRFH